MSNNNSEDNIFFGFILNSISTQFAKLYYCIIIIDLYSK